VLEYLRVHTRQMYILNCYTKGTSRVTDIIHRPLFVLPVILVRSLIVINKQHMQKQTSILSITCFTAT